MALPTRRPSPSRKSLCPSLLLFLFASLSGCGDGIPDFTPEELADATAQVREAYHLLDFEFGAELGEKWARWAPDALELKAWTVANLSGAELGGMAVGIAEEMMASHPDSPWSSFALAKVRVAARDEKNGDQALEASEKALAGLPDLVEAVVLRGEALFFFEDPDSAMAFAGTLSEAQRTHPDVRVALATAGFEAALPELFMEEDFDSAYTALRKKFFSTYEEILQEHPAHISASLGAGRFADEEEAGDFMQRATDQTFGPTAHLELWRAVKTDSTLTEEEKTERITSDVRDILENGGDSPARWAGLAVGLGSVDLTDLQAELDEMVLNDHPDGWAAEMILQDRIQSLAEEIWGAPGLVEGWDADRRERLAGMLQEFVERDRHHDPQVLLDAHWSGFILERGNPEADPQVLKGLADRVLAQMEVEEGPSPVWYRSFIALSLAERWPTLEDARNLVDQRMAYLDREEAEVAEEETGAESEDAESEEAAAEQEAADAVEVEAAETEGDGEDHEAEELGDEGDADPEIEAERAMLSAALGQAFILEGSLDEAEEELSRARDLESTDMLAMGVLSYSYLCSGRLMEKRAELARAGGDESEAGEFLRSADEFYLEGIRQGYFAAPEKGMPWVNPNETALESLYEEMHGSLEGFDEYLEAATDEDLEERRDRILDERIQDPEPATTFTLETLDGEEVNSESLLGRVAVINFWGTW